jgi:hypothetical protein
MVIGTALGWGNSATIALAVVLAFFFAYLLTLRPLLRKMSFASAARLALAADTVSITIMEVIDNAIMLIIPGAMDAGLTSAPFPGKSYCRPCRCRCRRFSSEPLAHLARQGPRRRSRTSLGGRSGSRTGKASAGSAPTSRACRRPYATT